MAVQWFVRLGAFGMALLFAAPALSQSSEPPARRAAAIADYRKSCGPMIGPYMVFGDPDSLFNQQRDASGYNRGNPDGQYGQFELLGVLGLRARLQNATRSEAAIRNPPDRLLKCATEVALRHALYGVPGYDRGAGGASPSTPAPRPNVAAKPRPAPLAQKLPPARPAKMAAWSPKAMSIDDAALSPRFASERGDILASCFGPLQQAATHDGITTAEASLLWEQGYLEDEFMTKSAQEVRQQVSNLERRIAAGDKWVVAFRIGLCLNQRRSAQLEGSPLATGAVDGTLTPLSIGGSGKPWVQQGKDARIIASDGKSAMDCVFLQNLASGDSATSGGGRVLVNRCTDEVEIGWCYSPGDCDTETGSGWTVQPGRSWPVKAQGTIRWAACHGRDTAAFVRGSHGLRYYCKAPASAARR